MADKTPLEPCCEAWSAAQGSGSDNESYGRLVYVRDDRLVRGSDLPPIRFCPWCGAKKWERRNWDDLPLGARFRYVGSTKIWVKLENGGAGVIAKWGDGEVGWRQSICSLCETEEERKTFIVEVIE